LRLLVVARALRARLLVCPKGRGGRHVLIGGSPGFGRAMLAWRLRTILPPLTRQGSIEITNVISADGEGDTAGS